MTRIAELCKSEFKGRGGFPRSGKPRQGSRKWVILTDGSKIKWWMGTWRFSKERFNTKVATSLNTRAMAKAIDNGRIVVDEERYANFDDFAKRMVGVIGLAELMKVVEYLKS